MPHRSLTSILRADAPLISIVERLYREERDRVVLIQEMLDALDESLTTPCGAGYMSIQSYKNDQGYILENVLYTEKLNDCAKYLDEYASKMNGSTIYAFFNPHNIITYQTAVEQRLDGDSRRLTSEFRTRGGYADLVGLLLYPEPDVACVVCFGLRRASALTRRELATLSRLALHIETALRLHRRPDQILGRLSLKGQLFDQEGELRDATLRALRGGVAQIEQARSQPTSAESLALWEAMIGGKICLVERGQGEDRHYAILANEPRNQQRRALTPIETDILELAARGLTNKLISYALGVSSSDISRHLIHAAAKLGATSRANLIQLAAAAKQSAQTTQESAANHIQRDTLTEAEAEIVKLIKAGLTNKQIAERRGSAERTIANHVASILKKLQAPSRRAIIADNGL